MRNEHAFGYTAAEGHFPAPEDITSGLSLPWWRRLLLYLYFGSVRGVCELRIVRNTFVVCAVRCESTGRSPLFFVKKQLLM